MKERKTIHPITRALLAIAALVVIVITGNMLVASLGLGHKTLDLTEDKVHSLSEGTESILEELAAPVTIRYYATRSTDYMPEELKLHMRRVDDLLAEYESIADGKLRVENLDPEPDTDAEDSADLDGIRGQSINNQNLYFGMAVTCLDQTTTLAFLNPQDETMLEYQISRAIAEVSAVKKPVIGIISALELAGSPGNVPGQGNQPWAIYQQLAQTYQIEDLTLAPESIDPGKYSLVLLIHPAGITPEAEFAVDQYMLGGGTVIACIDPYSIASQMLGGQPNPMTGQPSGAPTSSTLPTLLKAWGVEMPTNQVVGDAKYLTEMQGGRAGLAVITMPEEAMPQKDGVVTRNLSSVTFLLAGGMTKTGGSGLAMTTLVRTSNDSMLVDNLPASQLDQSLLTRFRADEKVYDLVLQLSGTFKTAFPEGKPTAEELEAIPGAETDEPGDDDTDNSIHLTTGEKPGNVFLISDVDAFFDPFAFQMQSMGNVQIATPTNGNSALLLNLVDQVASSTHLIGSRSRAATSRPFTVFQELEAVANKQVGEKIVAYETEAEEAQQRLNELQAEKTGAADLYLSPEQEAEIVKLRQEEVDARKQIRELEKDLRREKDQISGKIIAYNVAGVPVIVILVGIGLFIVRRARTGAR